MTANQFRNALDRLDLTQVGAAGLLRVGERSVRHWAADDRAIPEPVAILLRLMMQGKITASDVRNAH